MTYSNTNKYKKLRNNPLHPLGLRRKWQTIYGGVSFKLHLLWTARNAQKNGKEEKSIFSAQYALISLYCAYMVGRSRWTYTEQWLVKKWCRRKITIEFCLFRKSLFYCSLLKQSNLNVDVKFLVFEQSFPKYTSRARFGVRVEQHSGSSRREEIWVVKVYLLIHYTYQWLDSGCEQLIG